MSCFITTSCFLYWSKHTVPTWPCTLQHFSQQQDLLATCSYLRWEAMAIKWLKSLIYQQKQLVALSWCGCRWHYPSSTAWCVLVWGCGLPFESLMSSGAFWCFLLSTQEHGNDLSSSTAFLWNIRSEEIASRKQHVPGRGHLSQWCFHFSSCRAQNRLWLHSPRPAILTHGFTYTWAVF